MQEASYRISGFKEDITTDSFCENVYSGASHYTRLGHLKAPLAVFPHDTVSSMHIYTKDLALLENSSFKEPGSCIHIHINGQVGTVAVYAGDGGDGGDGSPVTFN